jgi:hypothetical protein
MTSVSDMALPSPAATVAMTFSALNPKGLKLKTLGDYIILLPPEIRYMIYDWLVAGRTIDVVQKWFQKPKNSLLPNDIIGNLCKDTGFWQTDISTWLVGRKELVSSKEMGVFDPRNSVFDLSFKEFLYKGKYNRSRRNEKRRWEECLAWDYFANSEIMTSVQYITVNLERSEIFLEDKDVSVFQLDLRSLGNFRNLQRIDFYLNETFIYEQINVRSYQEDEEEVPDLLPFFETVCRTFLQSLWKFCGWHHPSQACSCCQLPEVSFHYQQPGSDEWKPVILPFEKNEMVLNHKEAALEQRFKRQPHRDVLKHWVGWTLCRH